jgi:ornithine cyclodeaminase/alanine dehydrogenase-like protein (mu-crystallin family)
MKYDFMTEASRAPARTLVLTGREVRALLDVADCIDGLEAVFRAEAAGENGSRGVLGCPFPGGGFHVKAAGLSGSFFVTKINANFPANPGTSGLPTIQGVIALFDARDGRVLALLDSIEITALRTAAATAVAARRLARPGSSTAAIIGCGTQGREQLRALVRVLPISRVFAFDRDPAAAARFASDARSALDLDVRITATAAEASRESDVCVTSTPARVPLLGRHDVRPGTFVAAVGADDRGKQELESDLVASSVLVVDVLEQCAAMGELRHALESGLMTRESVHADLAALVSGTRPGRRSDDEITIFDSTGTALEDAAAAALVYERSIERGVGTSVALRGED